MTRRLITALRASGALVCAVGSLSAQGSDSACFGVRPRSGTVGIGHYECVGSGCMVNKRLDGGYAHLFTTEPTISEIDPKGPAAGVLRDGDVLVAVDDLLVTTREGGRRLASLEVGHPVRMVIRRGPTRLAVTLEPVLGCEIPSLAVIGGAPASVSKRAGTSDSIRVGPPIDLGMRLECGSCGWRSTSDGARRWYASRSPVVVGVAPGGAADLAGVKVGDVLDELDGSPLVAPDGSTRLGALRVGVPVDLRIRRMGSELTLRIAPRTSP